MCRGSCQCSITTVPVISSAHWVDIESRICASSTKPHHRYFSQISPIMNWERYEPPRLQNGIPIRLAPRTAAAAQKGGEENPPVSPCTAVTDMMLTNWTIRSPSKFPGYLAMEHPKDEGSTY